MTPRATYRMQFHAGFTFDDAVAQVPYLARLGISHLYASPIFKAHPGSTHGYDVVDYGALNPELGGDAGFERLSAALAANGLKLLLDVVPNHMGVGGSDNRFWLDLLEWGEEADHAGWFDIDWNPDHAYIQNKVLVPFLGDQYGAVLESGGLRLRFDAQDGSFAVWAHESHKLPISPATYEMVLGQGFAPLADLGDAFSDLMRWRPQIMRRARDLKDQLAEVARRPEARAALEDRLDAFTGREGDPATWAPLAALIARQNWKAAHHTVAGDDINYRRFFNIATLAGIRTEIPAVFDHAHSLLFSLMRKGALDGLRVDHIDGLFDPRSYLQRLRREAPVKQPFYLIVEKILGPEETLPDDWPVEGTTGYEVTNLLTALFVQPSSEEALTSLYQQTTGVTRAFEAIIFDSKLQILDNEMLSELHRVARSARGVARENPRTADFTSTSIQRAMRLLVASFPVYRTYVDGSGDALSDADRGRLDSAFASARLIDRVIDPSLFDFLRRLLSGDLAAEREAGYRRSDILRCAMRFQQYCGPVMAKGVEDTAFYRYNRFVALNEVGGAPERFGFDLGHFHDANRIRAERWPGAMLATSTHDTKRGEDTRMRLVALSTMPDAWARQVEAWGDIADRLPVAAGPDRNDRYLLFQLLVGTWPASFLGEGKPDADALAAYAERLRSVMTKSMREAKVHTTWTVPDDAYEAGTLGLVDALLTGDASSAFFDAFRLFVADLAARGAGNSFAHTVLKFTIPGMPDTYQGAEGWDLTMVDPDNRRPVDYGARASTLDRFLQAEDKAGALRQLWQDWRDGAFKTALTQLLLQLRAREPALLAEGGYLPLQPLEAPGQDVVAFLRTGVGVALAVLARRFPGSEDGATAEFIIPDTWRGWQAENQMTGGCSVLGATLSASTTLEGFPAVVLLLRPAA